MMNTLEVRSEILSHGYTPTPCRGKAAILPDWSCLPRPTVDDIQRWPRDATNTGILTRDNPVADIDIMHAAAAERVEELFKEWLDGMDGAILTRFGQVPKRALMFRTSDPFPKLDWHFVDPKGVYHKIEILGDGQQLIAHGIHPDTGEQYRWHGGAPWEAPSGDLVEVARQDFEDIRTTIEGALLEEFGFRPCDGPPGRKKGNGQDHGGAGPVDVEAELAEMTPATVNDVHIRVIPALIWQAENPNDIRDRLVDATLAMATRAGVPWTYAKEMRDVQARIKSSLKSLFMKDYDLAMGVPSWLCADWHADWVAALNSGLRPTVTLNGTGFYVKGLITETRGPEGVVEAAPDLTQGPLLGWTVYDPKNMKPASWLIKGVMPLSGVMILPGQWGVFKTTAALALADCIITGEPFAGEYKVKSPGGVMMYALEGERTIDVRMAAAVSASGRDPYADRPFYHKGECPVLTRPSAAAEIIAHIKAVDANCQERFGVPVRVVWIDTYSIAAGHTSSGDDNDRAATQKVYNNLRKIARDTGILVAVIDHYGKMIEAGTTGSAGKEGNADTVLANLGERGQSGDLANLRMVIRKQRDGMSGVEIPFTADKVELGLDEDGDPITAMALTFGAPRAARSVRAPSPNEDLFYRAMAQALREQGFQYNLGDWGREVLAVYEDHLKDTFYEMSPRGEGTDHQYHVRRAMNFSRILKKMIADGQIVRREDDGGDVLYRIQDAPDS